MNATLITAPVSQIERVRWLLFGPDEVGSSVLAQLEAETTDGAVIITATLRASQPVALVPALAIECRQSFCVAVYEHGVVQRVANRAGWAVSDSPFECAYTVSRTQGSVAITDPSGTASALCVWDEVRGSSTVVLTPRGTVPQSAEGWHEGAPDLAALCTQTVVGPDAPLVLTARIVASSDRVPPLWQEACAIPDPRDAEAHALALFASQVPSLGTLEIPGSAYPTAHLPRREYGSLHTFFDPDAWSVVASLSYSGIRPLEREARAVVERAIAHVDAEGLAPHHFDIEEPEYLAISGSPQPGPNLFLIEAAIDHACATGDSAWLLAAWDRGLRAAANWLLQRFDPDRRLLCVVGALWVDVFRRAGYTLDTNAMAVRTFRRAAEVAALAGDDAFAEALRAAAASIIEGLDSLWSDADDHFVTSRSADWSTVDDHLDAENYLAIATGAASAEQAARIVERFDGAPETHPGGRGTWVSLRRYDGPDCYLHNTGDSDIAMARLWWADMQARRALGDDDGFWRHFLPVRDDLLELVWMRERYAAGGHMTRAFGYHEYPGIVDLLLREAVYGLSIGIGAVDVAPFAAGPFSVRFGRAALQWSAERIVLTLPEALPRTVTIRRLTPGARYRVDGHHVVVDEHGILRLRIDAAALTLTSVPT